VKSPFASRANGFAGEVSAAALKVREFLILPAKRSVKESARTPRSSLEKDANRGKTTQNLPFSPRVRVDSIVLKN
jgi:hypothetical protein